MTDAYVDQLATELRQHRPDMLRAAEDELQRLRSLLATVVAFIHNPAHDAAARSTLADLLGLHAPRVPQEPG
jgi:hypothetical protein